jgi:hypothetical protein
MITNTNLTIHIIKTILISKLPDPVNFLFFVNISQCLFNKMSTPEFITKPKIIDKKNVIIWNLI